MAVYIQCPACHRKQALKNEICRNCSKPFDRVRKQNKANYWIYLRYRGKQVWELIGPSLTIAREQEVIRRAELVRDEYQPLDRTIKLKPFFQDSYLPWAKINKRSWDKDESRFKLHIIKFFGNVRLKDIDVKTVNGFKQKRHREGAKNATINRDLALLKSLINKAVKWESFRGLNPVSMAGMLPENNEHVARPLSEEEIERLLGELPGETKPIFEFAVATGIRIGNVMRMQWSHIDRKNKIIKLPTTKPKKSLQLPLNDWADDILNRVPRHIRSPYVFCKMNGDRYKWIHRGFKNALKRAGLETSIRIHDLRHSYGTLLASKGVPTSVLKDLLGHSSLAMVSRYTHLGHQTLVDMSNKMSRPSGNHANQYANKGE